MSAWIRSGSNRIPTARLTSTQMSVDTHVSGGSAQTLPLSVRNVLLAAETEK